MSSWLRSFTPKNYISTQKINKDKSSWALKRHSMPVVEDSRLDQMESHAHMNLIWQYGIYIGVVFLVISSVDCSQVRVSSAMRQFTSTPSPPLAAKGNFFLKDWKISYFFIVQLDKKNLALACLALIFNAMCYWIFFFMVWIFSILP